jgi:hypothetical protein
MFQESISRDIVADVVDEAVEEKRIAVGSFPYEGYDFSSTEEENLPLIADWCVSFANSNDERDVMWGSMPIVCNGNETRAPQADHVMVGTELNVIQQYNNGSLPKVGENLVFFNRYMKAQNTLMPKGPNRFNVNTTALFISSQAPSAAGEFCGWEKGIRFDKNSLSPSVEESAPTAIDMRDNTVMGAGGNPWLVLFRKGRYTYGIRFNTESMCIEFVKDVYGTQEVKHSFNMR